MKEKIVYLTSGALETINRMEKLEIPVISRIAKDLKSMMYGRNGKLKPGTPDLILTVDNITYENLKIAYGFLSDADYYQSFEDGDFDDFVKIFKNMKPRTTSSTYAKPPSSIVQSASNNKMIKFSDDFFIMLDKISDDVCWALYELESNPKMVNHLNIDKIDVSDNDYHFDVISNGKKGKVKIGSFIRSYFKDRFTADQVSEFIKRYNRLNDRESSKPSGDLIDVPEFQYDPSNVRSTFISLVTQTYPHGTEEDVLKYLPNDLKKDRHGNYYKIIGDSDTMFTSHLDTACKKQENVRLVSYKKSNQEFIMTDGTTILGADDKAGVTVMLYMMHHNVPGVYVFFMGEEVGGIGSGLMASDFTSYDFSKKITKVVSFDRRNYYSVITSQMGTECCSNEFGDSVRKELNKGGLKLNLDPTGVFTDSANFIDDVPECTNISVGYFNEHTVDEVQNITYLERLAKACVSADWSKLVVKRKVGIPQYIMHKWSKLIEDLKKLELYNKKKLKGINGRLYFNLEVDDNSVETIDSDMNQIDYVFSLYNSNPDVTFDGNIIKIEIK